MIVLFENHKISFLLKMDTQGIEEMLKYIEDGSIKSKIQIPIIHLRQERKLTIKIDADIDEMLIHKDEIELYMDEEELAYFYERLCHAFTNNCFYPAEVCERKYQNQYVTIYCDTIPFG